MVVYSEEEVKDFKNKIEKLEKELEDLENANFSDMVDLSKYESLMDSYVASKDKVRLREERVKELEEQLEKKLIVAPNVLSKIQNLEKIIEEQRNKINHQDSIINTFRARITNALENLD